MTWYASDDILVTIITVIINALNIIIIIVMLSGYDQRIICRRQNVRPGAEKSFVGAADKKRAPPEKIKHLYSAEIFQRRPDSFLISFMASRNITPGPTTAAQQTHRNFDRRTTGSDTASRGRNGVASWQHFANQDDVASFCSLDCLGNC